LSARGPRASPSFQSLVGRLTVQTWGRRPRHSRTVTEVAPSSGCAEKPRCRPGCCWASQLDRLLRRMNGGPGSEGSHVHAIVELDPNGDVRRVELSDDQRPASILVDDLVPLAR